MGQGWINSRTEHSVSSRGGVGHGGKAVGAGDVLVLECDKLQKRAERVSHHAFREVRIQAGNHHCYIVRNSSKSLFGIHFRHRGGKRAMIRRALSVQFYHFFLLPWEFEMVGTVPRSWRFTANLLLLGGSKICHADVSPRERELGNVTPGRTLAVILL